MLKEEVTLWINRVLSLALKNEALLDELSDGIVLCRLVQAVSKDISKTVRACVWLCAGARCGEFMDCPSIHCCVRCRWVACTRRRSPARSIRTRTFSPI